MGLLGVLGPTPPARPIVIQSPVEEIRQEIQEAQTVAHGQTVYLGDLELSWVDRLLAWYERR